MAGFVGAAPLPLPDDTPSKSEDMLEFTTTKLSDRVRSVPESPVSPFSLSDTFRLHSRNELNCSIMINRNERDKVEGCTEVIGCTDTSSDFSIANDIPVLVSNVVEDLTILLFPFVGNRFSNSFVKFVSLNNGAGGCS